MCSLACRDSLRTVVERMFARTHRLRRSRSTRSRGLCLIGKAEFHDYPNHAETLYSEVKRRRGRAAQGRDDNSRPDCPARNATARDAASGNTTAGYCCAGSTSSYLRPLRQRRTVRTVLTSTRQGTQSVARIKRQALRQERRRGATTAPTRSRSTAQVRAQVTVRGSDVALVRWKQ